MIIIKKSFIGIIILVIIILSFVVNYYIANKNFEKYTYIVCATSGVLENEELDSTRILFAFDENNMCVLSRFVWNFKTEEMAQKNYKNWKEAEISNLKIREKEVSFNDEEQLGKSKEEIKNGFNEYDIRFEY